MNISVNDQSISVSDNCTVADVVQQFCGDRQNGIALSVNQTVVPKANWNAHTIQSNDEVLIIRATQGG
jgi:sulfur carrier protein